MAVRLITNYMIGNNKQEETMRYKSCPNGHRYDASLPYCPQCGSGKTTGITEPEIEDVGKTQPDYSTNMFSLDQEYISDDPWQAKNSDNPEFSNFEKNDRIEMESEGPTIPDFDPNEPVGFDPVVGWLVCVKGSNRGKDYRIHNGNNFIGRSMNMDIQIANDDYVSNEYAAIIGYDDLEQKFFVAMGISSNLPRVNNITVTTEVYLKKYDKIKIGHTELIFIPLCGNDFDW